MPTLKPYRRHFVADDIDLKSPEAIDTLFKTLLALPLNTKEEVLTCIDRWSDTSACISEMESLCYVAMTGDTANKDAEASYLHIVERISPLVQKHEFALQTKLAHAPAFAELPAHFNVFTRNLKSDIDLFRDVNIPLQVEEEKLSQSYQKFTGGWLVDWDGEQLTRQQVQAKLEEPDRDLRERAFHAWMAPHVNDGKQLDELYGNMLTLREKIAKNADEKNFRDYQFKSFHRFDYSPKDCADFHEAIQKTIVPLVSERMEKRCKTMQLSSLRPWDMSVDEEGLAPIRPFSDADQLKQKVQEVANQVDAELGGFFQVMRTENLLDLESRKGKAPGGYMCDFPERRLPFIFMNAVGTKRDVETLLHESGHAYNLFLARELEPVHYHQPPLEFAEVASMSMELLAWPYLDKIYKPEEIERVKQQQLMGVLKFFPFMAMIDSFQHWVYTHPSTAESRGDYWGKLEDTYRPHIDWTGLETEKRIGWQYLHVFQYPFYYIEYGIAQLGALQVWQNANQDYEKAVKAYKSGLALGGSKGLPDLFKAVDGRFDMTQAMLTPLVEAIRKAL